MNKALESTLSGLIPSLVGPVPSELIDLSASLITQSRNRISNLKPAEEATRDYVCAHIACDRLRKKLDLPAIEPRPPLAKKAYGALYNQFHKALTTVSFRSQQVAPQAPLETPSTVSPISTPAAGSSDLSSVDPEIKAHVITLCRALGCPSAGIHIIAGTIATLKVAPDDKFPRRKNYPLPIITAAALLIIEKLLPEGKTITVGSAGKWRRGEGYCMKRDGVMNALGSVGEDGFTKEDTDGWVKDLSMMGIKELEWLKNVPDQGGIKKRKAAAANEEDLQLQAEILAGKATNTPARKKAVPKTKSKLGASSAPVEKKREVAFTPAPVAPMAARTLRARTRTETKVKEKEESGIGTMMQDKVDYLNPKRRKQYAGWKDDMLKKCTEVEKEITGHSQGQGQPVPV
ncbi:origin recognition complex subunit 6-domain-containing protein [Tuber brumale]|nr:origin recognition complex subunit 6-domain-containing protein [Tuber brumale]